MWQQKLQILSLFLFLLQTIWLINADDGTESRIPIALDYDLGETESTISPSLQFFFTPRFTVEGVVEPEESKRFALGVFFKTNWHRAGQYCRYRGMELASILSEEEEQTLEKQLEILGFDLGAVWTSGTDYAEEGVFFWSTLGIPVNFQQWGESQPDGHRTENCLAVAHSAEEGFNWHDYNCTNDLHFACQYYPSAYRFQPDPLKFV